MDGTSVRVAVRVRPLLDSEKKDRCTECVRVVANQPQVKVIPRKGNMNIDNIRK